MSESKSKKSTNKSKKTNSQTHHNIINDNDNDMELKEDCMDLIRAQNKKIQGLFSEIEKKDKLISQYQIKIKKLEEIKMENEFIKSQINSLNKEFESKINSMKEFYEKEIEKLLNEIKEKEEINSELLEDLQNIKQLLDENKKKFELIQNENKINIEKINKSLNSEKDYEIKAKELVNIIESQDIELKKFNEVVKNLKNIIDETNKINDNLSKENELLNKRNDEQGNAMINMNKIIEDLKLELKNNKEEIKKNGDINKNINKNYKVSLVKINEQEKEINILKNKNDELVKTMQKEKENNSLLNYSKNIYELLSYFKTVMNLGYTWASTYIRPHLGFEKLENIIKKNGFILGIQDLSKNIENNFNFGTLKKEANNNNSIKMIVEIYKEFVELIKVLYNEINEEFGKLNKIITVQKNGNSELLSRLNNIENNRAKLEEEFQRNITENNVNKNEINNIKNENDIIKKENNLIKNKIKNYEKEIDDIYQILSDFIKNNLNTLKSNKTFNNIFKDNLLKDENNLLTKLNVIRKNILNFGELSISTISEIRNQTDMLQDYNRLKDECKKITKELLQIKKEYSTLLDNLNEEKEKMAKIIKLEKEKEINILKKEDYDKINDLNKIIKKKEEEIEKLSNDNNLLYQQYTLSQNNFEKYKLSRKKDDMNIQEKINEMKKSIDNKNKEIKQWKNEKEIILNKTKIMEESLIKKNKENESLQKEINSLKKSKNLIV